ncbi:MAG: hypothetical protein LUF85_04040 [Bacteroides sp.]|nr:hypothetical protein [Bacteroides sp.]
MKYFLFCGFLFGLLWYTCGGSENSFLAEHPETILYTCMYTGEKEVSIPEEFSTPSHKPFSEVELNTYTLGLQYTSFARVKRNISVKYIHFLRNRQEENRWFMNGISHQKEQLYLTTFTPTLSPACTYYVYALRHILI